jgi:N-acetyl-anhydromuramyl-L-alanine amidase AmpD
MGNTYTYGIEAENNGLGEKWTPAQLNAYYRLCAALLDYMGTKDVSKVFGHKEWAPGRKIDPAGISMDQFRENVRKALNQGPSVVTVRLSRLQPGKRNRDVLRVKRRLEKRGFYKGKPDNNYFGKGLRSAYTKWQKHLGYDGTDANGIPGRTSLQKLGFRVVD